MHEHDPREFVRALQQILVSDSKRIGFLAGAGTSMLRERLSEDGKPIPIILGTKEMTTKIVGGFKDKKAVALEIIKKELNEDKAIFHIENIISKIAQKELV